MSEDSFASASEGSPRSISSQNTDDREVHGESREEEGKGFSAPSLQTLLPNPQQQQQSGMTDTHNVAATTTERERALSPAFGSFENNPTPRERREFVDGGGSGVSPNAASASGKKAGGSDGINDEDGLSVGASPAESLGDVGESTGTSTSAFKRKESSSPGKEKSSTPSPSSSSTTTTAATSGPATSASGIGQQRSLNKPSLLDPAIRANRATAGARHRAAFQSTRSSIGAFPVAEVANSHQQNKENDDVDDTGVFEIVDFSTVSPMERLCASLEEALHTWGLIGDGEHTKAMSLRRPLGEAYVISYHNIPCVAAHATPKEFHDSVTARNRSLLFRWFGVREFIVVQSSRNDFVGPDEETLLASVVAIVMDTTRCCLPCFVAVRHPSRATFFGYRLLPGRVTRYRSEVESVVPNKAQSLLGAVQFLTQSMVRHCKPGTFSLKDFALAAHYSYTRNLWPGVADSWRHVNGKSPHLRWGPFRDPLDELRIEVFWEWLPVSEIEKLIFHPSSGTESAEAESARGGSNPEDTDLDTAKATFWSLSVTFLQNAVGGASGSLRALTSLLAAALSPQSPPLLSETDPIRYLLSRPLPPCRLQGEGSDEVNSVLLGVFGLAGRDLSEEDGETDLGENGKNCLITDDHIELAKMLEVKSAPLESLTMLIAVHISHVIAQSDLRQPPATLVPSLGRLWLAVVARIRWHWETGVLLPRLTRAAADRGDVTSLDPHRIETGRRDDEDWPDYRCMLLHQKLQLINVCIQRKMRSEGMNAPPSPLPHSMPPRSPKASESEPETPSKTGEGGRGKKESRLRMLGNIIRRKAARVSESNSSRFSQHGAVSNVDRSNGGGAGDLSTGVIKEESSGKANEKRKQYGNIGSPRSPSPPPLSSESEDSVASDSDSESVNTTPQRLLTSPRKPSLIPRPQDARSRAGSEDDELGRGEIVSGKTLSVSGAPMYAPILQEREVVTYDEVAMHCRILAVYRAAGTPHATALPSVVSSSSPNPPAAGPQPLPSAAVPFHLRSYARAVQSDMSAFKAANPGAVFQDFLSWYTPLPASGAMSSFATSPSPSPPPTSTSVASFAASSSDSNTASPIPLTVITGPMDVRDSLSASVRDSIDSSGLAAASGIGPSDPNAPGAAVDAAMEQRRGSDSSDLGDDMHRRASGSSSSTAGDRWRGKWIAAATGGVALGAVDGSGSHSGGRRRRASVGMWEQVWESTPAVPASRQPLLFDFHTAAEKALHDLETMDAADICVALLHLILPLILNTFHNVIVASLPQVQPQLEELGALIKGLLPILPEEMDSEDEPRHSPATLQLKLFSPQPQPSLDCSEILSDTVANSRDRLGLLCERLLEIEQHLANSASLLSKFQGEEDIVEQLVATGAVSLGKGNRDDEVLDGGSQDRERNRHGRIGELFSSNTSLNAVEPDTREYVMRHRDAKEEDRTGSGVGEQRVFIRIGGSGFRVATALTSRDE